MSETGYQFPSSSAIPTFEEALADTSFYADHLSQSQQPQHPYQGAMTSKQLSTEIIEFKLCQLN